MRQMVNGAAGRSDLGGVQTGVSELVVLVAEHLLVVDNRDVYFFVGAAAARVLGGVGLHLHLA